MLYDNVYYYYYYHYYLINLQSSKKRKAGAAVNLNCKLGKVLKEFILLLWIIFYTNNSSRRVYINKVEQKILTTVLQIKLYFFKNQNAWVGPGTYEVKGSIEELLKKKTGTKGPYDCFSLDRNKPVLTGHRSVLVFNYYFYFIKTEK